MKRPTYDHSPEDDEENPCQECEALEFQWISACHEFLKVWLEAEFGPAHIVVSDYNFGEGHIEWCQGIIYAVQRAREELKRFNQTVVLEALYYDHSDNELEATKRFLDELSLGQPLTQMGIKDGKMAVIEVYRWQNVPQE